MVWRRSTSSKKELRSSSTPVEISTIQVSLFQHFFVFYVCLTQTDHSFKAVGLPEGMAIPEYSHAIADILRMPEGYSCDAIQLSDASLVKEGDTPPGSAMVTALVSYLIHSSNESFQNVILPLSCPMPKAQEIQGLGDFDFTEHEDLIFGANKYHCTTDWLAALLCPGAFTPVHNDHLLCGQYMVHNFGRKVLADFYFYFFLN